MGTQAAKREGEHTEDDRLDAGAAAEEAEKVASTWDDNDGRYQVSFGVDKCRRYHEKMTAFYQGWSDYTNLANAVCGLSAFLALFGGKDSTLAQAMVAAVTVLSTIAGTLKPSRKAKVHSDLTRRFTDLSGSIAAREPTDANLRWAQAQRKRIEKDEPPVRRLVDLQASNEERRSRGADHQIPLSWPQRTFGYWLTFGMARLERWEAGRRGRGELE